MKSKILFTLILILIITIIPVMNVTAQWWWSTTTTTTSTVQTYTITAWTGSGGFITPSGEVIVQEGASQTFIISPNGGHSCSVTVDGVSQGSISSYTFENVTSDHTIYALCGINPPTTSTTTTSVDGSTPMPTPVPTPVPTPFNETFDNEPGGRFTINMETRTWNSGVIDISREGIFTLFAMVEGDNTETMESSDYLNMYYSIDGGSFNVLCEITDGFSLHAVTAGGVSGSTMVVKLEGKTDAADEFYYVDEIRCAHGGGPTTVPTPQPTPVITTTSTTTTSSGWWGW